MSCDNTTPSLHPVGIAYDSRNRPVGLSELSSVLVTSLSATSAVTTNYITPLSGTIVRVLGTLSATSYLGAGGGGVSQFVDLTDVESTASLIPASRGFLIAVNENGNLTTSAVSSVNFEAGFINASSISSTYATLGYTTALDDRIVLLEDEIFNFSSLADVTIGSPSNGNVIIWSSTAARWVNVASSVLSTGGGVTTFVALTDTPSNYTGASSAFLKVNSAGTAVEFVADPGYITTASADSRYLNSSGDYCSGTLSALNLSSNSIVTINFDATEVITDTLTVNSIANSLLFTNNSNAVVGIPLDGDFSLGTIPAGNSFLGLDSAGTTVVSYPKSDYVLVTTNTNLSSTVANHIASASVHFTASSLSSSPGYALSSWTEDRYVLSSVNFNLSSLVTNHVASASVHFFASSLSSNPGYALSSWTNATYSLNTHEHNLEDLTDTAIVDPQPADYLTWNGSKWVNSIMPVAPNLGGLTDVNTAGASTNNSLIFNGSTWIASPIDHGVLSGLGDNDHPQYALSSWTETQYLNASGDSANTAFFLSSLSSTTISATVTSSVSSFIGTSAFYVNGNRIPYRQPIEVMYLGSGTQIATTANVPTPLFSATIPANTMRAGDALRVEAWGQILVSAVTGVAANTSAFVLYGNTSALASKADVYWMNLVAAIASGGATARTLHWDVNVFAQTSSYQVVYGEVEYTTGAFGGTKGEGAATATSNTQGIFKHTNGANPTKSLNQDQQIFIGWNWVASPGADGYCKLDMVTMTVIRNPANY